MYIFLLKSATSQLYVRNFGVTLSPSRMDAPLPRNFVTKILKFPPMLYRPEG